MYFKSRKNRSNSPTSASVTRFISSKDLNQEAVKNDKIARKNTIGPGSSNVGQDMSGTGFTLKEMTAEANAVPQERGVHYKDVALIRETVTEEEKEYFDGHKDDILRIVTDHGFMKTF